MLIYFKYNTIKKKKKKKKGIKKNKKKNINTKIKINL
jgi:hypothetical protein